MIDITQTDLVAAIIDQMVAGLLPDRRYAFVVVPSADQFVLGVAVENENGYSPLNGKTFASYADAREWAESLNRHIGLTDVEATRIICSTMRSVGY